MIISRVLGGLGNQMFQYAIAKAIAKKNNTIYKLDIELFERYKLFPYKLNTFNIEENIAIHDEIKKYHGDQSLFSKVLRRVKMSKYFYREKDKFVFDSNVFKYTNIYLDGYWQNDKYFREIQNELRREFTPKKVSESIEELCNKIKNENSVSIHIRRGDYKEHVKFGLLPMEYYKEAINIITKTVNDTKFYIFSNDSEWCKENFVLLKDRYIVKGSSEVEDLYLMQHCKYNIIANSTFSWWAAWLNGYEKKIIIAPKFWKKSSEKSSQWLPKEWIKI